VKRRTKKPHPNPTLPRPLDEAFKAYLRAPIAIHHFGGAYPHGGATTMNAKDAQGRGDTRGYARPNGRSNIDGYE
jgi:hypothetical protein